MLSDELTAVFEPRRVAVVGASDRPGSVGELMWRNLGDFAGDVVAVTRAASQVGGRPAYSSLRDVPEPVDLAIVVVPAAGVPDVVRDAAVAGVRAIVVVSGGFAETGPEGARLQDDLMTVARAGGVRVVGPNCLGVVNSALRLNATIGAVDASVPGWGEAAGGVSLVTQSGAYGMAIQSLGTESGMRFAKVCSEGNKVDVGDVELLRYLGGDPDTRAVCFFVESLPDGRAFAELAREVVAIKPVVVARTGRSRAGARAAVSHTAALAGSERVWRAALAGSGVVLARSGQEMLDAALALELQPAPAGNRVAVITNSGGTGVELADLLADVGVDVPELSPVLRQDLDRLLPAYASSANPVDVTPVWQRFTDLYPLLTDRLARSGEVDAVVPVLLQRAATPAVATAVRDAVLALRKDGVQVPVYVCWVARHSTRRDAAVLFEAGVPCFDWPDRTARAVGHAVGYGATRARTGAVASTPVRTAAVPRPPWLPALPQGWLEPELGERLLAGFGITVVPGATCADEEAAVAAAGRIGYPVVAKAVHQELVHKSAAGGVRLGLATPEQVRRAAGDLLDLRPGARVLVQRQVAGAELMVGGLRDPEFGPVVLVGLGGVQVEDLDDVAVGLAPLTKATARRLLGRLRGHGALSRGGLDLPAVAEVACSVGALVLALPEVAELDLNPVVVTASGVTVADWRVRVDHAGVMPESALPGRGDPAGSPRGAGETSGADP